MSTSRIIRRQFLTICAVCVGAATHAHARPATEELSYLLNTHPQIREARDNYRSALANQDNAFASFLPQANLSVDKGFEIIDSPARRANPGEESRLSNEQATLTVTTPLFTGFRNEATHNSAKVDVEIQRQTLDLTVQTLLAGALSAYIQTKKSLDKLEIAKQSIALTSEQVSLQDELVSRGTGIQLDLLVAKTALQDQKANLAVVESEFAAALAQYEQFFGSPPDLQSLTEIEIPSELVPSSLDEAVELALSNNVGIDIAGYQIDRAREQIRSAKSTYYPDVNLVTTYNWENNIDATRGIRTDFSVVLESSWQIFDGFGTQARAASARHQASAARNRNRFTHRQVSQETQTTWSQYQASIKQEALFKEAAALAQEVVSAQKELQESGRETAIALLQAELAALDREGALIDVRADRKVAAYQLLFRMGQLTPSLLGLPGVDADQEDRGDVPLRTPTSD